jgi:hypothetical protein
VTTNLEFNFEARHKTENFWYAVIHFACATFSLILLLNMVMWLLNPVLLQILNEQFTYRISILIVVCDASLAVNVSAVIHYFLKEIEIEEKKP